MTSTYPYQTDPNNPLAGWVNPSKPPSPYTLAGVGSPSAASASSIGDVGPTLPGMSIGDYRGAGASESALGNVPWGKIAAAGAPLALSMFAPKGIDVTGPIKEAQQSARSLGTQANVLSGQGTQALAPVLHYLAAVTSGDPSAIMAATMPERRRVIDQYDTAKQAAQFTPRGGGASAALTGLNTAEAGDLAAISGKAQTEGMKASQELGTALASAGIQGKSAAASHLSNLIGPMLSEKQQDQNQVFNTFANLAGLMAMFI